MIIAVDTTIHTSNKHHATQKHSTRNQQNPHILLRKYSISLHTYTLQRIKYINIKYVILSYNNLLYWYPWWTLQKQAQTLWHWLFSRLHRCHYNNIRQQVRTSASLLQNHCSNHSPILEDRDDHDWTKGLFLGNEILVLHIREDGWLHKETWRRTTQQYNGQTRELTNTTFIPTPTAELNIPPRLPLWLQVWLNLNNYSSLYLVCPPSCLHTQE